MGKFEKQNRPAYKASQAEQHVRRKKKKKGNTGLLIGIVAFALVLVACAVFILLGQKDTPPDNKIRLETYIAGIDVGGLTKEEALQLLCRTYPPIQEPTSDAEGNSDPMIAELYPDKNMNITLYTRGESFPVFTTTYDPSTEVVTDIYGKPIENPQTTEPATEETTEPTEADPDAPVDENGVPYVAEQTICLPASHVQVRLDLSAAVELAYTYGREVDAEDGRVDVDLSECMSLDTEYIRDVLESTAEDVLSEGTESVVEKGKTTITVTDEEGASEVEADCLNITIGTVSRKIDVDKLCGAVIEAYHSATFDLQYIYEEAVPAPVDLDALYTQYKCVAPVNAVCDPETYQITDGKNGYGFLMKDAYAILQGAKPGDTVILTLIELEPEYTRETLDGQLFTDILGSCKSPHVWNPTRTRNLELAAAAINGTVLAPGAEFSFNKIVGERTAEKGYGEAGVYVGGRTENQLGGGVCQVASAIYYSVLKADLEVVERYEHQYTPTYVPWGMDATIYWGALDFRFRNNTPYPLRIDASVYDGYVFIDLVGTETRDYTVKLDYSVIEEDKAEEKTIYIHPDMKDYSKYKDYKHGETIQTAYDGYKVKTYMYKYDLNGNHLSTSWVNNSNYDRRDKEIAYVLDPSKPMQEQIDAIENPTESTDPSEPPEPSTDPSEPPEPSTDPSEPPEPSTDPTEPPEPSTDPTEPSTDPTESESTETSE